MNKVFKTIPIFVGIVLCLWIYSDNKDDSAKQNLNELLVSDPVDNEQSQHKSDSLPLNPASKNLSDNETQDVEKEDEPVYIVDCNLAQITSYEHISNADIIATFQASNSVEKQLAYALYSELTGEDSRLDRLLKFNQQFPDNAIALEQTLGLCTELTDHPSCNQELVEQAIAAGGQNAAMWFAIASFYASKGEPDMVKNAFRNIISAPLYEESFANYIELYINTLQGRPEEDFTTNALSAFGAVAAQPSFFNIVSKVCTEKPKEDYEFLLLCLSLGQTMESRGKTNLTQMIGGAFQEIVYELEDNDAALKELSARQNKAVIPHLNKATNLSLFDQRLFRSWLNNVRNLGEHEAAQLVVEEAIELSKNPYYQPCPK